MEQEELLQVAHEVVNAARRAGADVAEAVYGYNRHLSLKVRLSETELIEEAGGRSLGLRVMLGQQVAVTHTSDLTASGRRRLVEDAVELARLSQADPFAGGPDASLLSRAEQYRDLETFDSRIDELSAEVALSMTREAEAAAQRFDTRITNSEGATASRMTGGRVFVTSGGFAGGAESTYASLVVTPIAEEGDGKKRRGHHWTAARFLSDLESPTAVGEEAARRTLRKLGAHKIDSAEMPVVFDPDSARAILGLFAGCVMGTSIWRRSSYLLERLGTMVASELVNIVDDPLIPRAPGSRNFDGEGLLSRQNHVVRNGKLETYLLDSYSARKLSMESTASAARSGSGGVGPGTTNFVLSAGSMTPDELISSTKRGLYVTEMMGFGFNGVTGDFSRGASGFLIENGELTQPVSEVTISLNLDEILKRIDAVANDVDMRTATAAPTFRVSAMTIAGR